MSAISISVNGQSQHVPVGHTVAQLLNDLCLTGKRLAVELNGEIVPKGLHANTTLHNNDTLEIVVAVGGG